MQKSWWGKGRCERKEGELTKGVQCGYCHDIGASVPPWVSNRLEQNTLQNGQVNAAFFIHQPPFHSYSFINALALPSGRDTEELQGKFGTVWVASLLVQMVKNLPVMWETQVRPLGLEDPLEKGMATHPSIFAWKIPWIEEPGGL